ncbi:MAG: hypothetical protein ABTQ34_06965 [Bdellovibrionales bacterium]
MSDKLTAIDEKSAWSILCGGDPETPTAPQRLSHRIEAFKAYSKTLSGVPYQSLPRTAKNIGKYPATARNFADFASRFGNGASDGGIGALLRMMQGNPFLKSHLAQQIWLHYLQDRRQNNVIYIGKYNEELAEGKTNELMRAFTVSEMLMAKAAPMMTFGAATASYGVGGLIIGLGKVSLAAIPAAIMGSIGLQALCAVSAGAAVMGLVGWGMHLYGKFRVAPRAKPLAQAIEDVSDALVQDKKFRAQAMESQLFHNEFVKQEIKNRQEDIIKRENNLRAPTRKSAVACG